MKRFLFLLATCGLLPGVWAYQDDDHRREEPRVILYQNADYRGDFLEIYPGEAIENFSGRTFSNGSRLNDSVSSIRVEGGAQAYVYSEARFHGAAMRVTENVRDLTGRFLSEHSPESWNDRISSVKVEGPAHSEGRDRGRSNDYDVVIRRVFKEVMGREPDEASLRRYRGYMIDQGWNERMLRDQLLHGDEFRRENADRVIRRAYQDLLGREVDPSGLNHYRKFMLEKDWTEGDVRDDLRRSAEYRNREKAPHKP